MRRFKFGNSSFCSWEADRLFVELGLSVTARLLVLLSPLLVDRSVSSGLAVDELGSERLLELEVFFLRAVTRAGSTVLGLLGAGDMLGEGVSRYRSGVGVGVLCARPLEAVLQMVTSAFVELACQGWIDPLFSV